MDFEKLIDLAPPSSDRKANYQIASAIVQSLQEIQMTLAVIAEELSIARTGEGFEDETGELEAGDDAAVAEQAAPIVLNESEADRFLDALDDASFEPVAETDLSEHEPEFPRFSSRAPRLQNAERVTSNSGEEVKLEGFADKEQDLTAAVSAQLAKDIPIEESGE